MIKPSTLALSAAKKRARARGKTGTPVNIMDVLKVLDTLVVRIEKLEKEVHSKRDY